jgi:hypothetical protein
LQANGAASGTNNDVSSMSERLTAKLFIRWEQ